MRLILDILACILIFIGFGSFVSCLQSQPLFGGKQKTALFGVGMIIAAYLLMSIGSGSSSSNQCVICGRTDGLRHITAQSASGEWDDSWYCEEHYADAWQYYYGNN
ncbi:MAG: hypothetical protein J6E46_10735 [Faecalicoccus sp.]|nr:hypothetical protein [Faecalicoccus sp.]